MSWNYRIVASRIGNDSNDDIFGVREVYYDDDGEIQFVTTGRLTIGGETIDDIKQTILLIQEGLNKPVIDITSLVA